MTKRWESAFFSRHRKQLTEALRGGLVVISAHSLMQRRSDMAYRFVQEANFWYLSGIEEPDWKMVYDGSREHMWLVRPQISQAQRLFDGELTDDQALKISGANQVIAAEEFENLLRRLSTTHAAVHTLTPAQDGLAPTVTVNPSMRQLGRVLERIFGSVIDCRQELVSLRAIKSAEEITAIKQAVDITCGAFEQARAQLDEVSYEYEVEAQLGSVIRSAGARHAYAPIVAAGVNACTLHYSQNQAPIRKGAPILIDVGAEHRGYCADITRTYVKGEPSKRYRQLHQVLDDARRQIINMITPNMPVAEYINYTDIIMKQALLEVGLINDPDDARYRQYFPHAVSHGLGIDVHDSLGGSRVLRPGMVITVEPGIYVPAEKIGIRLEDDIVITETGVDNLSQKLSTAWA